MSRLVVLALLCACQHDAPPPSTPSTSSEATSDTPYLQLERKLPHMLRVIGELGESLDATAGNCKLVASTLRQFGLAHRADLAEVTRLMDQLTADERERFELAHADDRRQLETTYAKLHFGCDADPEVQAAIEVAGFRRTH
jgi:hypothetical protein